MDKAFEIQKQCRDNVKSLQTYLTDLQNWESEMKRKEAALNGEFEQNLPPVRSTINKEKPVVKKKPPAKKIKATDYNSWEKFDVEKACEEVEMEDIGPTSLDGKKSQQTKMEMLREEAQYEKERGNTYVKNEKWDEAIKCYNRAIELVKDDAIYYANRGLCYLKKDSLHQAETDCTEALRLDPTYVKAYQRRATAREKLGSLRSASHDLNEVIKLEPHNMAARRQLESIKVRMGTKGAKSKSSPTTTPKENKSVKSNLQSKIVEIQDVPNAEPVKVQSALEKWRDGIDEDVTVIKLVKKPPHLRSKRPLKSIPIHEIQLGNTSPEKPPTRLKIIEIEDNFANGDSNNNDSNKNEGIVKQIACKGDQDVGKGMPSPESVKLISDVVGKEKVRVNDLVAPVNSVQFMSQWKCLMGNSEARSDYLYLIEPSKIPSIFENSLESDIVSEIIHILYENPDKFKEKSVACYLKGLSGVKRFSALAMFLSKGDKEKITKLLDHCASVEKCSEADIAHLKNKYEL